MRLSEAFEVVLDLARQGVLDAPEDYDLVEEYQRQEEAIELVERFARSEPVAAVVSAWDEG